MRSLKKKYVSREEALKRLQKYCAYQERCHQEVRNKLANWGLFGEYADEVTSELVLEGFLNEERFARAYARGKFRMKGRGRRRIEYELKQKNINAYCIRKAMEEIDPKAYRQSLADQLKRKARELKSKDAWERRSKLKAFAYRQGFETEIIHEMVEQILGNG
jgi:regulatory protein